jgi:Skp family chaperone for outer membrane proteins
MVKKYSESHYAFKNVQNKLDQMLGKFQNQKNVSNNKINNKEQNYERS